MIKDNKNEEQQNDNFEADEDKLLESLYETVNDETDKSKASEIRSKIIKQKGFYAAVLKTDYGPDRLSMATKKHKEEHDASHKDWDNIYQSWVNRIDKKIERAEVCIKTCEAKKNDVHEDIEDLKTKRRSINKNIDDLQIDLGECRKALLLSQEGVEDKFINKANSEITKLAELQKKLYEEIKEVNQKKYDHTKTGLDYLKQKLIKTREIYEVRFNLINDKIKLFGADGINNYASYVLLYLGLATTGVAGYFFAIFSAQSKLSNQDMLSYLLINILKAVGDDKHPFLFKVAVLFGIIVAITVVSWIIHLIIVIGIPAIEKQQSTDIQTNILTADLESKNVNYSANIQTKSWFSFWLRIVPFVLIAGLTVIIISSNEKSQAGANDLSASTEGLIVGAAFALGLAAVVYIYIIKVIEPRIEAKAEEQESKRNGTMSEDESWQYEALKNKLINRVKLNWEVAAGIVLFFFSALLFLFYQQELLPQNFLAHPSISISIIGFTASSILASFAFAYGVRFFGLLESASAAQRNLNIIDSTIATYSIPVAPDVQVSLKGNIELLSEVQYNLLKKRGSILINKGRRLSAKVPGKQSWTKILPDYLIFKNAASKQREEDELFEVYEWEMEYYPELTEKIRIIRSHYLEKKAELAEIELKINQIRKDKEDKITSLNKEIQVLIEDVEKWQTLKSKGYKLQFDRAQIKTKKLEEEISWLEDGFALGLWYLANNILNSNLNYNNALITN